MGARSTRYQGRNQKPRSVKYLNTLARGTNGNYYLARDAFARANGYMFDTTAELSSRFDEETKYEFISHEKDYWSEFFVFWDDVKNEPHVEMEFAKPFIIDCLYENSGVGIVMINNKPLVYRLAMFWRNDFFEITRATGIIYAYPTDYDASLPNYSLMNRFDLTNGNCALELSSMDAKPWGFGIDAWATRYKNYYVALDINTVNSLNTKLISAQNISENSRAEISTMHAGARPWYIIDGMVDRVFDLGLENKISHIAFGIDHLQKEWRRMRGMRQNFDAKNERNIKDEVGKNDATFIVLENKKYRILKDLCEKINKLWPETHVSVKKVMDIYDLEKTKLSALPIMLGNQVRADGEIEKQEVANDGRAQQSKGAQ